MKKIEQAITSLQDMERGAGASALHPVCLLLITLTYLTAMLSVPVSALGMLLWFALYPILAAPLCGLDFSSVFLKSLVALPFIALIGIFNPIIDTETAFTAGGVAVSRGWISFASIIVRGLLSVQALLILTSSVGFVRLCHSLERIGVPVLLTTQLMMVYRYLTTLLQEALDMARARRSRGYGRRNMPLKMWGPFIGQLFMRTIARSEAVNRAMLARGFTGRMPRYETVTVKWKPRDTAFLTASAAAFAFFRFVNIAALLGLNNIHTL